MDDGELCVFCFNAVTTRGVEDDDGDISPICERCLRAQVVDYLLAQVNRGEMRIAADGKTFEFTDVFRARMEYEEGEEEDE